MTERFIVDTAGTLIDMVTRNTYDYVSEVCPLLNDIDSENTHVKYSLSAHMVDLNNCKGKCSALEEENEQLKSTINTLTHDNTKMKKVLNTTKKENEHIKNTIQEAYNNERTHIGKSVLKQLMEAIQ